MSQEELFDDVSLYSKEWVGMPEYIQERTEYHCIKVSFGDKDSMIRFSKLLKANVSLETKILYYPEKQSESSSGKVYSG